MNNKSKQEGYQEVVIIGSGGMAVEAVTYINDIVTQSTMYDKGLVVSDIVSNDFTRLEDIKNILGYQVSTHQNLIDVPSFKKKRSVIAIGSNSVVFKIRKEVLSLKGSFLSIIHPSAYISPTSRIGEGVIVAPFCFIGPFARVGHNCILNVRATIGHDALIGNGVIISPHVDINGAATIGDHSFIGAGAIIDPLVKIGNFCKVSSGTALAKNLPSGAITIDRKNAKQIKMFSEKDGSSLFAKPIS